MQCTNILKYSKLYVWNANVQRKEKKKKNLKDSERKRLNCRTLILN